MTDTMPPYRSPSLTDEGLDLTPRRASSPTPPPAAPTDDLDDAGPPTTPSNRAPASGVVPGGEGEVAPADPDALTFITADDLAADLDASKRRADGTDKPVPLPWPDVARQLGGGLWPGLHILVGGSGVGKTTMALQIALEAAFQGHPTCYVGLELEPRQVRLRLLALHAGVPWSAVYTGRHLDGSDARPVIATAARLAPVIAGLPIAVEGASPEGWPASRLERVAEQLRRRYHDKPALIVLDFLQLLGPEKHNGRADLRERIGQAAYQARHVAKDYGAAVLAISSTARDKYDALGIGVDGKTARDQAHPAGIGVMAKDGAFARTMSNRDALIGMGKESGEVEYAADSVNVLLRWRDSAPGSGGVIFASPKVRVGVEGWCELAFNGTRYSDGNGSIAGAFAAYATKSTKAAAAKSTNPPSNETDDGGDLPEGWGRLCAGNFPHRNRPINGPVR